MRVSVTSFGYKHGLPRDADLIFDVRFLPNPHWVAELRPLRGTDPPVRITSCPFPRRLSSLRSEGPVGFPDPSLRGGGEVLSGDRHRLHRWAPPLGGPGGGNPGLARGAGDWRRGCVTGTSTRDSGRHQAPTRDDRMRDRRDRRLWPSAAGTVSLAPSRLSRHTPPRSPPSWRWPTTAAPPDDSPADSGCHLRATSGGACSPLPPRVRSGPSSSPIVSAAATSRIIRSATSSSRP